MAHRRLTAVHELNAHWIMQGLHRRRSQDKALPSEAREMQLQQTLKSCDAQNHPPPAPRSTRHESRRTCKNLFFCWFFFLRQGFQLEIFHHESIVFENSLNSVPPRSCCNIISLLARWSVDRLCFTAQLHKIYWCFGVTSTLEIHLKQTKGVSVWYGKSGRITDIYFEIRWER